LETCALIGQFSDAIETEVDDLLANGVVAAGEVVGSVLLAGDELLRMEQLSVSTSSDLVNDRGLEVDKDGAGDVLASSCFREESVESVVTAPDCLVGGHLAVRLDSVLEAKQLPAGVADLDASLTNVDGNDFSHYNMSERTEKSKK
jgi:hypothetical protein